MPYKYYMGKTGRVWNVSKRAIGVELLKTVGNRKRTKRIMVRVEHLRKSECQTKFKNRVRSNESAKVAARKGEARVSLKRVPHGPKP